MQTEHSPCASGMNGLWTAAPNGRLILDWEGWWRHSLSHNGTWYCHCALTQKGSTHSEENGLTSFHKISARRELKWLTEGHSKSFPLVTFPPAFEVVGNYTRSAAEWRTEFQKLKGKDILQTLRWIYPQVWEGLWWSSKQMIVIL